MKHLVFGKPQNGKIQFFRYLFVGASSAVVDLIVFGFLNSVLDINYLIAAFFAYMIGLSWNYSFALLWVFKSRHSRLKEMVMVLLIALGGLAWTEFLLWVGVEIFGFIPFPTKCVVLWIVLIWNFGMRKWLVFH